MRIIRDKMSKNSRYGTTFSRESDSSIVDDHWFKQYQKTLQKDAVEPINRGKSIYDQISAIINKKSKFPSVEAAVKDMQERSGMHAYWEKVSENKDKFKVAENVDEKSDLPSILIKFPMIKNTLENYVRDTKGNIDLPAVLEKIKNIHKFDGPQSKDWEDESFIRFVNKLNFSEKQKYNNDSANFSKLGRVDNQNSADVDPANTDAFHSLQPVKI